MGSKTPFFDRAARLAELRARFFVPGHKGNAKAIAPFGSVLRYDLTEIKGADDLSHPSGPLAESEGNMAKVYGSGASLYSASGATSCIEAMLGLFLAPEAPVVMARGCHMAALRSLVFTGARPVWVQTAEGRLRPEDLAPVLEKYPGAPVYLTSPDYYGRMSEVEALSCVCAAAGSPLLVDNAHGAHLRFLRPDRHPLSLGADATADSAHKTLPCLTGAALLHLREEGLAQRAREMLNLYSSTSPSYLVLESLDLCAGLLLEKKPDFAGAAERLAEAAASFTHLLVPCDDPMKLCLCPQRAGWEADVVLGALEKAGIFPEFYDGRNLVLMAGPYNHPEDFHSLSRALSPFRQKDRVCLSEEPPLPLPRQVCTPRQAFFAPRERVSVKRAAGRVRRCPPGVPLVVPGERISGEAAQALGAGGILALDVLK
ncbi:amino acid decarboxylase [Ruminococcaceae bacterium OttesenSCG-928-I18]|nr:amino acid decarboxylase [Ruminococcaceae bacterium OttesenSCG-928-I18]